MMAVRQEAQHDHAGQIREKGPGTRQKAWSPRVLSGTGAGAVFPAQQHWKSRSIAIAWGAEARTCVRGQVVGLANPKD